MLELFADVGTRNAHIDLLLYIVTDGFQWNPRLSQFQSSLSGPLLKRWILSWPSATKCSVVHLRKRNDSPARDFRQRANRIS